jgi:transcriptional regulator with XRE-family HTH domain
VSPDPLAAFDWRTSLRSWRKRLGLSQDAVAEEAGISSSALRAYERGTRNPSERALRAIVSAMGIPREDANMIYAGAGFSVDWRSLLQDRYIFSHDQMRLHLDGLPWPSFITDQSVNLVAWNSHFEAIWDTDFATERLGPGERNFLGGISDPRMARHLVNFDEVVMFLLGLAKADPRRQQDLENPAPWLREAMAHFFRGDPALIRRVMNLWDRTEPVPHRSRHQYHVRWRYRDTQLSFMGLLTIADIWSELSWNDWVPADEKTWRFLRDLRARGRAPAGVQ